MRIEQRRFAGTVLADDGAHLASGHFHRNVVNRDEPAEAAGIGAFGGASAHSFDPFTSPEGEQPSVGEFSATAETFAGRVHVGGTATGL
jgi:hypothetical protein